MIKMDVKLSQEQKDAYIAAANKKGWNLSTWIRWIADQASGYRDVA